MDLIAGTFAYQLQNVDIAQLKESPYEYLVLDSDQDISELVKQGRKVFGYVSIGEAENYRGYWRPHWNTKRPNWIGEENKDWEGNFTIKEFMHPDWKRVLRSIVENLIEKGFSGMVLDKVDAYEDQGGGEFYKQEMIELVGFLSTYTKKLKPGFQVMVHNSSELIMNPIYLKSIDGITQEELLYRQEVKTLQAEKTAIIENLNRAKDAGKRVWVIEYVSGAEWDAAKTELQELGFSSYEAPKDLGSLPVQTSHEPA